MNIDNGALTTIISTPLISFHSIIDEDMACLKYAILDIGPNPSFDLEKIKSKSYINILGNLYYRKYENPLYYIASENADKDLLDRVRDELLCEREKDVLKHAKTTDMINFVDSFKNVPEINPTILYYTEAQLNILKNIKELKKIPFISIKDAITLENKWTQFFFRYISELEPFNDLADRTYYFSTMPINLIEDNSDINIDQETMAMLIRHRNKISLYDIYRTDIIGRYKNDS